MKNILKILGWQTDGQRAPLPGEAMVPNSAGGYVYALDDWARLDRFLVLGTEGGTYYAGERKLTVEAGIVMDVHSAPPRIVDVSTTSASSAGAGWTTY